MNTKSMRNKLFGAIADEFPKAKVSHFAPLHFIISEEVEGKIVMIPVSMNPEEAKLAKSPDALIKVYVAAARTSFDQTVGNRVPQSSVLIPTPQTTNGGHHG